MALTQLPLWIVIDPRTGESVELRASTRGAAARGGSALLTLKASTLDPDVLAREVIVLSKRDGQVRVSARPSWAAEASTSG